jgi:hypothetical protein
VAPGAPSRTADFLSARCQRRLAGSGVNGTRSRREGHLLTPQRGMARYTPDSQWRKPPVLTIGSDLADSEEASRGGIRLRPFQSKRRFAVKESGNKRQARVQTTGLMSSTRERPTRA